MTGKQASATALVLGAAILGAVGAAAAENARWYVGFEVRDTVHDPPWATTPEELEALDLPTYAQALRTPGRLVALQNFSEYERMLSEMHNRSTRYVVYGGGNYSLTFVTESGTPPPPPSPPSPTPPTTPSGPPPLPPPTDPPGGQPEPGKTSAAVPLGPWVVFAAFAGAGLLTGARRR